MRTKLILLIVFALCAGLVSAQEPEVTTITLPALDLEAGTSLVYDIEINCLADGCSAFDITLSYDPTLIQVDELEVGPYLGEDVFEVENSIDPETGTLRLVAAALGDLPETEDAVLMRIHLTALGSGEASFTVDHLDIGDLLGSPVEVEVIEGEAAVVVTPEVTPEVTPTIAPTATRAPTATPAPCTVYAEDADVVEVRVGPGLHRTSVTFLPPDTQFLVLGRTEDSSGAVWYQLDKEQAAPGKLITEAWVASEDVVASAGCDAVAEVSAPPIVPIQQGRPTTAPSGGNNNNNTNAPAIQRLQASSPECQVIETLNPNPFELGVSWSTSNHQSEYYRAVPGGSNRFRVAHDPHSSRDSIDVELVVSTTEGHWVHTLKLTVDAC